MTRLQAKFASGPQPVLSLDMVSRPAEANQIITEATAHVPGAKAAVSTVADQVAARARTVLAGRNTAEARDLAAHVKVKPVKEFKRRDEGETTTEVALVAADGLAAARHEYGSGSSKHGTPALHFLGIAARSAAASARVVFKKRGKR